MKALELMSNINLITFVSTLMCSPHFLLQLQFALAKGAECERIWQKFSWNFLNDVGWHRYNYSNVSETWRNASCICNKFGAHLASIGDEDENNLVLSLTNKTNTVSPVWIGLRKDVNNSHYIWSDASYKNYTNWLSGAPNRSLSVSHCVVQKSDGNWTDVPCTEHHYFLCEKETNDTISFQMQTTSAVSPSASSLSISTTQKPSIFTGQVSPNSSAMISEGTMSTQVKMQSHQPATMSVLGDLSGSGNESNTSGNDEEEKGSGDTTNRIWNTDSSSHTATTTSVTTVTIVKESSKSVTFYISISVGIGGSVVLFLLCLTCMYCYQQRKVKRLVEDYEKSQKPSLEPLSNSSDTLSATKAHEPEMDDCAYAMTRFVTQNPTENSLSQVKDQASLHVYSSVDNKYCDSEKDGSKESDIYPLEDDDGYAEPTCSVNSPLEKKKETDEVEKPYSHLDLGFSRFRTATYWQPEKNEEELYAQLEGKKFPQISRQTLKMTEHLGSGEFGNVSKGFWHLKSQTPVAVAIKTLNSESIGDRTKFLREAAIMGQFHHRNIVALFGVVTVGKPLMIVIELMEKGDLRENLLQLRTESEEKALPPDIQSKLLLMAREIAAGMEYLGSKSFVHRDLATRNVLLNHESTCKIGDFGLTRDLADETYYLTSGGKVPIRWTSPEALNYKKYSSSSDVWSYGVVLYEIWSLAERPFGYISNKDVMDKIDSGYRLPPPPGCPRALYALMIDCWNPDYHLRPSFTDIANRMAVADDQLLINKRDEEIITGHLGDDLQIAEKMYYDLQQTYI